MRGTRLGGSRRAGVSCSLLSAYSRASERAAELAEQRAATVTVGRGAEQQRERAVAPNPRTTRDRARE